MLTGWGSSGRVSWPLLCAPLEKANTQLPEAAASVCRDCPCALGTLPLLPFGNENIKHRAELKPLTEISILPK